MKVWCALVLFCMSVYSLPSKSGEQETLRGNYATEASQFLATQLLKFNIDIDGNQVYSPLGIASILTVLAEGSTGATYEEFENVFGYPRERTMLRNSFKRILANYQTKDYDAEQPSFQNWFYIYRNYTVKDDFKRLVQDNYFVEIKDINHRDYDWSEPNASLDIESSTEISNSKDVIGFETLKRIKTTSEGTYVEEVINKEASKFDRFVDDKQYVEKPVALAEIDAHKNQQQEQLENENFEENSTRTETPEKQEKLAATLAQPEENLASKTKNKRDNYVNVEENETIQEDEKQRKSYEQSESIPIQEVLISNEPEKVSLPLISKEKANKGTIEEIMLAMESHLSTVSRVYGARSLFRKDDIASGLSANSITGRKVGSKTKMLLFNGLYYRGQWATPLYELPNANEFFFMTKEDAVETPMMHAKGQFYVAELENLNAKFVCLPYQNKKYELSIVLPNEPEGLNGVIEKLKPRDFSNAQKMAKLQDLHISLPKFQVEETSRSEAMLKQLGLNKLFSRTESDLSLLSDDADLHIDEIVQFVSVRIDNGGSGINALSATSSQGRTSNTTELEKFEINRPFLYFVMDCEEGFILASGKVYTPEYKEEQSISLEIELNKA